MCAVAAMTAVLLSAGGAQARIGVGENYRLLSDPRPERGKDAVGFAVNPRNERHIVEVNADWNDGECEYNVSFDRGRTWRGGDLAAPTGFSPLPCAVGRHLAAHMDGSVVFGSGENVYTTFASPRAVPGGADQGKSVLVAASRDGGRTFRTAVVALSGGPSVEQGPDYVLPKLAVERGGGRGERRRPDRLYVVAGSTEVEHEALPGENTVLAVSDDAGRTWSGPLRANGPDEAALEQSQPVIGRDGALYVAWRERGRAAEPGRFLPQGFVVVGRSTDRGRTWTRVRTAQVTGYVHEGPPQPPFATVQTFTASTFPRLVADPRSGNLYLAYGEGPKPAPTRASGAMRRGPVRARAADHFIHPDLDVYFQRSTNGGRTWSAPAQINDPLPVRTEITQTRHPNLSVAPNGRVDIVWHDRRHWYRGCVHTHRPCEEARLGDTDLA